MEKEKLARVETWKKRNWEKTDVGKRENQEKLKFWRLGKGKSHTIKGDMKNKEIWFNQKKGIILEILTFLKNVLNI